MDQRRTNLVSQPEMDVPRVREIAQRMRELGLPEATVRLIEREADEAEERQNTGTRLSDAEVLDLLTKRLDPNNDGIVDYDPAAAAYWAMVVLHDLGLIRTGAIRKAWERSDA